MRTLGFFSQKGGSGKTVLSCHTAVAAQQDGKKVVLIDCDEQGSATSWGKTRAGDKPMIVAATPSNIDQVLQAAKDEKYTLAILDCPPHAMAGVLNFINRCDHIIVPCQPAAFDISAAGRAVSLLDANHRSFSFVINRAPLRAPEIEETRTVLSESGTVSPVVISDRRSFGRALITGKAVTEYETEGKAADEVRALWKWIKGVMK